MIEIEGKVRGTIHYPDHPEHEGEWGLQGGEDVFCMRDTFRSIGEAMTWCRRILDGDKRPRTWEAAGKLLEPHTEPLWAEAEVKVRAANGYGIDNVAEYSTGYGRTWVDDNRRVVVRHDDD